jgi:cell shape-determining protein MreD
VFTSGAGWAIARVMCLLTIAGFCVATVWLFARQPWWERGTLGSAVLGLVALLPYWLAATLGGEPTGTTTWNAFVHVVMLARIFVLLLVPQRERWVDRHVMSS